MVCLDVVMLLWLVSLPILVVQIYDNTSGCEELSLRPLNPFSRTGCISQLFVDAHVSQSEMCTRMIEDGA